MINDMNENNLKLLVSASGTSNQLIDFLRNAADQIERDSQRSQPPWFNFQNGGGFMGSFTVNDVPLIDNISQVYSERTPFEECLQRRS